MDPILHYIVACCQDTGADCYCKNSTSHKRQALKNEHTELTLKGFILAHE